MEMEALERFLRNGHETTTLYNCLGFVLFSLRVTGREHYVDPVTFKWLREGLGKFGFVLTALKHDHPEAEALLAVKTREHGLITHGAIICGNNPTLLAHREGLGDEIEGSLNVTDVFRRYRHSRTIGIKIRRIRS